MSVSGGRAARPAVGRLVSSAGGAKPAGARGPKRTKPPAVAGSAPPEAQVPRTLSEAERGVPLLARALASYYLVLFSAGLLLLLGLVMVLSASSVRSYEDFGSSYTVFIKQVTWVGLGLPVALVASRLPVRVYRRLVYPVLAGTLVLLVLVLIPGIGDVRGGARRWIAIGSFTIQPSELAKFALALWGADLLVRKHKLLGEAKHLLVPLVPVSFLFFLLVMLEPDMGTTIIILVVLVTLLWVVGTPMRLFLGLNAVLLALGIVLAVTERYRFERLLSFRDPFADEFETGFQAVQGLYALSSGGWWGEGLGASREKWPGLLPAAHTDFILAIIGEELGLPGSLGVVLLFGVLGYAGIRIAHRTDDPFIRLAAASSTCWILTQAMVNMAAVVGLLPITGIPLPLVSFGGSSLILTILTIGMLLSFARSEPAAAALLAERASARRLARRAARERRADRRGPGGGRRLRWPLARSRDSGRLRPVPDPEREA